MAELRISDDLALPLEAVTEPMGMLAARRAGKSNAAVVLAEEMYRNHLHWVAIDPKGDWWGIRSGAEGGAGGLEVPILGGAHGDVPLEPGAGALIADLVVDQRLTCLLDVSGFASEAEKIRFLLAFGDRLFRRKEQGQEPTHVFFEEADDYVPQRAFPEQARLVHVMSRILKQGGSRGLGGTVISQRSAVVHKDILSQVQTLFALRTTGPQDRKAIRDWVSFSGENPAIVESLPELADGEAWVWSPNFLRTTQRFQFRRRSTFDSGATPKIGASRRAPATLADVDLGVLSERMAETIEKAKAEDPRELRKRIHELERQAAAAVQRLAETETVAEPEVREVIVEVPVLNGQVEDLRAVIDDMLVVGDRLAQASTVLNDVGERILVAIDRVSAAPRAAPVQTEHRVPTRQSLVRPGQEQPGAPSASPPARVVSAPAGGAPEGEASLSKAERLILATLAQYPEGRTRLQLTLLTGYPPKGSTLRNSLGTLRGAGLVTKTGEPILATVEGRAAAGDVELLPPAGPELVAHWRSRLGQAERAVLDVLVAAYPNDATRQEIGEGTGYPEAGSSIRNALGRLRGLGLVEGWRASSDLVGR